MASKIGHALVRTHDYTKAINYYEAAVKSGGQASLRKDLAQLYLKLKQPDKAAKVPASAPLAHILGLSSTPTPLRPAPFPSRRCSKLPWTTRTPTTWWS